MEESSDANESNPGVTTKPVRTVAKTTIRIVLFIALFGAVSLATFRGLQDAREAARRSACSENLKKIGTAFRAYAEANHGEWPKLDTQSGKLLFPLNSLYPEYLSDPSVFVCPSDSAAGATLKAIGKADAEAYCANSSYVYLGYMFSSENEGLALIEAIHQTLANGTPLPDQLPVFPSYHGGSQRRFQALKAGVERFLITDIHGIATGERYQFLIPVLFERTFNHEGRTNVLFMDGHVETIWLDGPQPRYAINSSHVGKKFLTALESLKRLRSAKTSGAATAPIEGTVDSSLSSDVALIRGMKDENPYVREAAASALESVPALASVAVESLARNLGDSDAAVRVASARALAHGLSARDVAMVCRGAHIALPRHEQRQVAEVLLKASPLQSGLAEALKHSDAQVRAGAADLIGFVDRAQSFVSLLTEALLDSSPDVRRAATQAFVHGAGFSDTTTAIPALIARLKDTDEEARIAAGQALERFHAIAQPAAVPLAEAVNDPSARVAASAAMALSWYKPEDPALGPRILALADSKEEFERAGAAAALGRIREKSPKTRQALLRLLADPTYDVQVCALRSLTTYRLDDEIYKAVVAQVGMSDPPQPGPREVPGLDGKKIVAPLRREIGIIAQFKDPRVVPVLRAALTLWNGATARSAKEGLQSLGQ